LADDIAAEYKGTAGNFSKALVILLTFTLIFLFLILIPYHSLRGEGSEQRANVTYYSNTTKNLENRLNAMDKITNGLHELRLILARTPEERLLNVSDFMERQAENGTLYLDSCSQDYHPRTQTATWTWCKLKLINDFEKSEARRIILNEIENPFKQVVKKEDRDRYAQNESLDPNLIKIPNNPELFMYAELRAWRLMDDITSLYDNYYKIINDNSDVLNSTEVREKVIQEMNENLLEFYRAHSAIGWQRSFIGSLQGDLFSTLNALYAAKAILDQRILEISEQENDIASKIESLEFPYGAIPVGLNEAIALFPVLLAGGSLLTTEMLVKSIKIRHKLHEYRKKEECKAGKFDINSFVLFFHLWLDPADNKFTKFIKFGILLIPLVGYVVSYLLIQQLALLNTFEDNRFVGIDNGIFIWILYPVLIVFFVYGYVDLIKTYRCYSDYYKNNKGCREKNALGSVLG
jgi:hypothetical protein